MIMQLRCHTLQDREGMSGGGPGVLPLPAPALRGGKGTGWDIKRCWEARGSWQDNSCESHTASSRGAGAAGQGRHPQVCWAARPHCR